MKLQWLGHSGFRIVGSKVIVTDPYDGIGISFPSVKADIVTISHAHRDHSATDKVAGEPALVDDAGEHRIGDVHVTGFSTYHDPEQGAQRGKNLIFLIEMDGMRIVHMGDLGVMPNDDILTALGKVDVLLIPVGGNYTLDAEQAAQVVQRIRPSTVVPMHYKTPGVSVAVSGVEAFLALMPEATHVDGYETEFRHNNPEVLVFSKSMAE